MGRKFSFDKHCHMRIESCWFCGGPAYPGHGIAFVRNDAKMFRFCRSKCHKSFLRKKNPRKTRWTKPFRRAAGKDLTLDSVFDFEKKRNEPQKYDRELYSKALKAMKRIKEIKARREKSFIEARLDERRYKALKDELKEAERHSKFRLDVIAAPGEVKPLPDKMRPQPKAVKAKLQKQRSEKKMDVDK